MCSRPGDYFLVTCISGNKSIFLIGLRLAEHLVEFSVTPTVDYLKQKTCFKVLTKLTFWITV